MIDVNHEVSLRRQCELLGVSRSGYYYDPVGIAEEDLDLMRRIDELHLTWPFYGSRKIGQVLRTEGIVVNRKRAQRLMRLLGIEAMVPKPDTSRPAPEHPRYPYLLRNLKISRVNQVWAADITYIPLARGFVYLVAVMDWYSRHVLAWRLSNTMETSFCLEALDEALEHCGKPEIFNTDQGAQFTDADFTGRLRDAGIKISMDGTGRYSDNIFVERLWRSLKYEEVYLHAYETPREAREGIARWMTFYGNQRPHQALGYQAPGPFYQDMKQQAVSRASTTPGGSLTAPPRLSTASESPPDPLISIYKRLPSLVTCNVLPHCGDDGGYSFWYSPSPQVTP